MMIKSSVKYSSFIRGLHAMLKRIGSFFLFRRKFAKCADNVIISPPMNVGNFKNVYWGDNVNIGPNAHISAVKAKFICKGHCAIAENLTVHTGNHARMVGMFVNDISREKKPDGYDKDVIIEEDVWIGCNVTLLAGIRIGRGATIAAGAVVAKSLPPYCICGGIPAKFIKFYWTIDQILEHEAKLYPEKERYSREQLEEIFAKWERK